MAAISKLISVPLAATKNLSSSLHIEKSSQPIKAIQFLIRFYKIDDKGPFINNVRTRGEGRGLTYLVKLIKERRGEGA